MDAFSVEAEVFTFRDIGHPYPAKFRRQMVDLVRSGRTDDELSREFEPTAREIWNRVRQAERHGGVPRDEDLP